MNRTRLTQIFICTAIVLPALMLGTVHSQALGVTLLLATFMFSLLALQPPVKLDWGGVLFLLMIVFTAVQLLPLPAGWVEFLSPASFHIQQGAMAAIGKNAPAWMSLTVDVPLTTEELAKLFFYLSLYWSIQSVARQKGTDYVLQAATAIGVLGAVILLAHKIAMLDKVYGVYTPIHVNFGNRVSAPFINENHMAALLSLSSFVSIGLAVRTAERSKRMLLIAFNAIIGGALLLTLSRGGIAAYIAGQLLFITMVVLRSARQKSSQQEDSFRLAWLPLGLAFSLGLGMLAAQDAIIGEYIYHDAHKVEIFNESLPLLQRFPFFGAGRGAFEMVFPQVSSWASQVTFTHAENVLVQLLVDDGVVMGTLVLLGFAVLVAQRILTVPARPVTAAVIAALIATGIHNLVDFNLEFPGVAAVAVALLAVLTTSKRRTAMKHPLWQVPVSKHIMWGPAAVSSVLSLLLFFHLPDCHIETVRMQAQEELQKKESTWFSAAELAPRLRQHPASSYLPFYAGVYHFRHRTDISPLPLFAHAVEQNPYAGAPHYYIGRLLLDAGYASQAMLEFRLAARNDARFARFGAAALVNRSPRFATWKSWPITSEDRRLLYEALAVEFSSRGLDREAAFADRQLLRLKPPTAGALGREARRRAVTDANTAIRLASQLRLMEGHEMNGLLLTADIQVMSGHADDAVHTLEQAPTWAKRDLRYLRQLAELYQTVGNHTRAIATVRELRIQSDSPLSRARAVELEGDLEQRAGNLHSAEARYKQALAMVPDNIGFLTKLLHSARLTKDLDTEIATLKRLGELEPQEKKWSEQLKAHEAKIIPPEI